MEHQYLQLKEHFQLPPALKHEQTTCIQHILDGKNVFTVLPTGYGKTLTFVLPPLIMNHVSFLALESFLHLFTLKCTTKNCIFGLILRHYNI